MSAFTIKAKALIKNNRGFIAFMLGLVLFRGAIADWNVVPSGSMKPTILIGDVIWLNRLAYDVNVPFTDIHLAHLGDPARGDVVVFDSAKLNERLVKRIIGLPGDTIALRDDHLIINGEPAAYQPLGDNGDASRFDEKLGTMSHKMQVLGKYVPQSNFGPVTVPTGQYLVLGDNRDNSADSRFIGFIPRDEIVGRATGVLASFNPDHYFLPRFSRFVSSFHTLN